MAQNMTTATPFNFSGGLMGNTVQPINMGSASMPTSNSGLTMQTTPPAPTSGAAGLASATGLPASTFNTIFPSSTPDTASATVANPNSSTIAKVHAATLASLNGTGLPGGTNSMGTPILTQDELNTQNAKNGITQNGGNGQSTSGVPVTPSTGGTSTSATATPTFGGLLGGLASTTQSSPYTIAAQDLLKKEQDITGQLGPALATVTNTPGVLANQNARASNVTQAYGQEMQGLGNILGQANALQGTQQSGLESAAGLAHPTGNFPFVFDPTTSSYSVSGGNLQGAISSGVQQAVSNPALYTSLHDAIQSTYGAASAGMFQQSYINAGGNPQTAAAQGSAAASNVQTGGTLDVNTAASIYGSYAPQIMGMQTALNQVQGLGNLALQTQAGGNINPLQLLQGNATLAQVRRQLSSPSQGQFDSSMQALSRSLSNLFAGSSSVTPSQISDWQGAIINGSMPADTLKSVINQAITEGNIQLNTLKNTAGAAHSQAVSGSTSGTNTSGGAFSNSSFYGTGQ